MAAEAASQPPGNATGAGETAAANVPTPLAPEEVAAANVPTPLAPEEVAEATAAMAAERAKRTAAPPPGLFDFLRLPPNEQRKLRVRLAQYMCIRYDNCNSALPFAQEVGGVRPYGAEDVAKMRDDCVKAMAKAAKEGTPMDCSGCVATVINGCQVCWDASALANAGYVEAWGSKHLHAWDCSIERKAGGWDDGCDAAAQHFHCTSNSSLMSMIAEVVRQFTATGSVEEHLQKAFTSIRILLFFEANVHEMVMMNHSENIEQAERKRHGELDNIAAVRSFMGSLSTHNVLKSDSGLDVFKYPCKEKEANPNRSGAGDEGKGSTPVLCANDTGFN